MIEQRAEPETLFTLHLPLPSCDEKKVNEVVQPTVDNFSLNTLHKSLACNTADSGKIIKLRCHLCCSFCCYLCCPMCCLCVNVYCNTATG